MNLQFQPLLPSLHTQSHLPQRGRLQGLYNFLIMYKLVNLYILRLAPSDEGAVDCKLTVRQFTFYKSTEGGKNYKLDELIGYYLIYLHYIIIPANPNLSFSPLPTDKIEKTKFILLIYLNLQTNLKSPQIK